MKLKRWLWSTGEPHGWAHWCPACRRTHVFAVDSPNIGNGAQWSFDGNQESPTFNPSMLIRHYEHDGTTVKEVCHYFLHAGHIQFLADCTHAMAGQIVPLPEYPEGEAP